MTQYTEEFERYHAEHSAREWNDVLKEHGRAPKPMPRGFNDGYKERHWAFWQQSRASLCVELPDRIDRGCDCESCDCGNSSDAESVARADSHNSLLSEITEAITKTGVRVK